MPNKNFIDETGNIYGKLKVIRAERPQGSKKTLWYCECECGNTIYCSGSELRKGYRTSCGKHCNNIKELEIGKIYGYLKILKKDNTPPKNFADRCAHWICECQLCGTIKSISGKSIRNGDTKSCGCLESHGEREIAKILLKNNILFEKEYIFEDLKGKNNLHYRFDFAIFENNKLLGLIEFQGAQHFREMKLARDSLVERQQRDKIKLDYCLKNNYNILYINNNTEKYNIKEEELEKEILFYYNIIKEKNINGKIFNYNH